MRQRKHSARRCGVEQLEVRQLLADIVVDTLSDTIQYPYGTPISGLQPGVTPISLRDAISAANVTPGEDTITFSVTGQIDIANPMPFITDSLDIRGPRALSMRLRATTGSFGPILWFNNLSNNPDLTARVSGVTITNGQSGGIRSSFEKLTVADTLIAGNTSFGFGAGITARHLTMSNSTVASNQIVPDPNDFAQIPSSGGGIYLEGSGVISDSLIVNNSAFANGLNSGAIFSGPRFPGTAAGGVMLANATGGSLEILRTTISNNTADAEFGAGGGCCG